MTELCSENLGLVRFYTLGSKEVVYQIGYLHRSKHPHCQLGHILLVNQGKYMSQLLEDDKILEVVYEIVTNKGETLHISNPSDLPDIGTIDEMREPICEANILVPKDYVGNVIALCVEKRGVQKDMQFIGHSGLHQKQPHCGCDLRTHSLCHHHRPH